MGVGVGGGIVGVGVGCGVGVGVVCGVVVEMRVHACMHVRGQGVRRKYTPHYCSLVPLLPIRYYPSLLPLTFFVAAFSMPALSTYQLLEWRWR